MEENKVPLGDLEDEWKVGRGQLRKDHPVGTDTAAGADRGGLDKVLREEADGQTSADPE